MNFVLGLLFHIAKSLSSILRC